LHPPRDSAEVGLVFDHGGEGFGHVLALKKPLAGEHFVEHDAESPDVDALVDNFAARLLRRHIGGGAEDDAHARGHCFSWGVGGERRCFTRPLGQAEIEHFDRAVGLDLDVARLQIPVNDAFVMRGFKRVRDLACDGESFIERDGAFGNAAGKRGAFDQLHDEVIRADVVKLADVGMVQRGDGAGFTIEALGESLFGNLDSDFAAQACIEGAVNLTHPACAEIRQDFVGAEAGSRSQWHRGHMILSKPDRRWFD
jgi:hypothetical protein